MYMPVIFATSLVAASLIAFGLAMELSPSFRNGSYQRWMQPTLVSNVVLFMIGMVALIVLGSQEVLATAAEAPTPDLMHTQASVGLGLELIAIGIPTLGSILAAGVAVSRIGAAGLAVVAEKPEIFGRTLIYLGLAEGLAIYGLVLSILMMGKL
ncbi:ATPase [Achromatium sp. WMS2]|nr:ATPase [Achromatium sp. WMS2]